MIRSLYSGNSLFKRCFFVSLLAITFLPVNAQVSYSVSPTPANFPSNTAFTASALHRWLTADFDLDGDIDVLYQAGSTAGQGIVYLENNNGSFTSNAANASGQFTGGPFNGISFTIIANSFSNPNQQLGDYDNDGDLDILELQTAGTRYLQNNAGVYSIAPAPTGFPPVILVSRWVTGDFNNDGAIDILCQTVNYTGQGIICLVNNGSGSFTQFAASSSGVFTTGPFAGITFTFVSPTTSAAQLVGDYDNDGDDDIYERDISGNCRYFEQRATGMVPGTFPPTFPSTIVNTVLTRWIPADYDGDGDIDVLSQFSNTASTAVTYHVNNGSGSYTTHPTTSGVFTSGPFSGLNFPFVATSNLGVHIGVADYDNDGDVDLFEARSGLVQFIKNNGVPPRLSSTYPADNSTSMIATDNIVLNFNVPVTADTGRIVIYNSNGTIFETIPANNARVTGSGTTTITVNPAADLALSGSYYITFGKNTFKNAAGTGFGRIDQRTKNTIGFTSATFLNFTVGSTLPVTLSRFDLTLSGQTVLLEWITENESNSLRFDVQHSTDGINWTTIGSIAATGNSTQSQRYSFRHNPTVNGSNVYRLKQVDIDGKSEYSALRRIKFSSADRLLVVVTNPVAGGNIQFRLTKPAFVQVTTANGLLIMHRSFTGGTHTIDLSRFGKGNYFISAGGESRGFILP